MKPADRARVTTHVAVDPADAFEVFTEETDLWWRRGPRYRFGGKQTGTLRFEPGVGGRLIEVFDGGDTRAHEVGKILVWEPARRLVFEWRNRNFAPGEKTEVEVVFEPTDGGTRVTVEHRGWSAVREDHPSRHGLGSGDAFTSMIGYWWGDLVTGFRAHVDAKRG
jgi:uncharacterized protein YndB with AHSA1/START domain